VNHGDLFEVDSTSENLTGTVQICSVRRSQSLHLARGDEIAPSSVPGCSDAVDYFRSAISSIVLVMSGSIDVAAWTSTDNQSESEATLLVPA